MAIQIQLLSFQHVTTFGGSDGRIELGVTGGTELDSFQFGIQLPGGWLYSDFAEATIYAFENLAAGDYNTSVQNLGGEADQMLVTLTQPAGPVYPADGTFIRNDCNGVNLQQVVADGSGGERWGNVVEYNSTSCGYTAPPDEAEEEPQPEEPTSYSENITIQVQACRPGVLLRWLNSLGGVESWLFSGKVNLPFASEAVGEYVQANGLKRTTQRRGTPGMVVRTSGLNLNQYRALCELYTSPHVWIEEAGQQKQVYVVPGSVDTDPFRKSYELAVELQEAPVNAISN